MLDDEGATPLDLFNNKNYTTQEIKNYRYDICKSCEKFIKAARVCKKCKCFMPAKTWLKDVSCPLGKWHKDTHE